jgi:hypothetical protein
MADDTLYVFVAEPTITAYQLAQIMQTAKLQLDQTLYDALPEDVQQFFVVKELPIEGAE